MSWCTNCKTEFTDDLTQCPTCKNNLLESSDKYNYEAVAYVEEEIADRLVKLLKFSDIPEAIKVYDSLNDSFEVQVDRMNYKKATDLIRIFKENEFDANYIEDAEFGDDEEFTEVVIPSTNTYIKTSEKYNDNISSAYTFLICGSFGLLILILEDFGLIKLLGMSGLSKILLNIIIGGLFLAFICIGIASLKYSKVLKKQADEEDEFTLKLMDWLREKLSQQEIEKTISDNIPEEAKYFKRVENIKHKLEEEYSSLDEEFLIKIADDYYNELYNNH